MDNSGTIVIILKCPNFLYSRILQLNFDVWVGDMNLSQFAELVCLAVVPDTEEPQNMTVVVQELT